MHGIWFATSGDNDRRVHLSVNMKLFNLQFVGRHALNFHQFSYKPKINLRARAGKGNTEKIKLKSGMKEI